MHHCFGVIPVKKEQGKWFVFLVRQHQGHFSFPKGHVEPDETERETAARELKEETGFSIKTWLFPEKTFQESYNYLDEKGSQEKVVRYFLAEVTGALVLQKKEIIEGHWFSLEEAFNALNFAEAKKICKDVTYFLLNKVL